MSATALARQPSRAMRPVNNSASRREKLAQLVRKEAALQRAMSDSNGLKKIAANMANPVRQRLDYKGIFRKFVVVEQVPDGIPLIYDRDLPQVPAIKVGPFSTVRTVEMRGKRIELFSFEIAARPKIPYAELYNRRFRVLDRAKDRLIEGMELREDLIGFGLLDAAFAVGSAITTGSFPGPIGVSTTGPFDRDPLARAFTQIEKSRLPVAGVLMSPFGTQGIRRLDFHTLDQVGMQEVRETGFLGSIWGADFYVSDQIRLNRAYVLTSPKFLGWMPIRKDVDVIPADDPDNLRLGLVGYENVSLTIHNAYGVAVLDFSITV